MTQATKAKAFADFHVKGNPVVLYNIWDAGGARAVAEAGAKAVATGSWSVAAAHGYPDGEQIPLALVLQIVARIVESVDLPVTVDFEGGYAEAPEEMRINVGRLMETGAVGLNFEDQVVGGEGLYAPNVQARRIEAVRSACEAAGVPAFINARTDLFLKEGNTSKHAGLVDEAIARAKMYREAGADGFFVPALTDGVLIGQVCQAVELPVNVMMGPLASVDAVAQHGIGRASFGPGPYHAAVAGIRDRFAALR